MRLLPTLWLGRLALHIGMQSRGSNGENPPWMGFAYGSWLPRMRASPAGCVSGISGYWLCFHWSVDWWPHRVGWGLR